MHLSQLSILFHENILLDRLTAVREEGDGRGGRDWMKVGEGINHNPETDNKVVMTKGKGWDWREVGKEVGGWGHL